VKEAVSRKLQKY